VRRAVPAVAAVAVALAGGAAVRADGTARVVAEDRDGHTVAELELPRSGAFALAYRHSYYRRPAIERFVAGPDGSFRLVEVASPSEAVLDYYEIEGAKRRSGGWWHLRPDHPARFERMALAATAVGRRTLVAGREREPLFRGDGRVSHLTIAVEGG
jgi:hypothetical protein